MHEFIINHKGVFNMVLFPFQDRDLTEKVMESALVSWMMNKKKDNKYDS